MISAKLIKHSIGSCNEQQIATFELEYPRFIHSELMTHRLFSRNAASSRAIPINKMMDMVNESPAMPVEWGINKSGMQALEVHTETSTCVWAWKRAAQRAVESARELQALGLHKQIVNRVLEPFQTMKTIVTATDFDNFFWLRCHADAQPEIKVLAELMYATYIKSTPQVLGFDEWHTPYVDYCSETKSYYSDGELVSEENAIKISSSCCAQVSYRVLDDSLDKAVRIYDQLVTMVPVHASPFEHVARPLDEVMYKDIMKWVSDETLMEGVTHVDNNFNVYSGNFKNWVQYRQLIKGNVCNEYKP